MRTVNLVSLMRLMLTSEVGHKAHGPQWFIKGERGHICEGELSLLV